MSLALPKTPPLRDRKYLDWLRTQPCVVSNCNETEPAHLRWHTDGGTGMKPSDCYAFPLHYSLHRKQHQIGEPEFWLEMVNENPWFLAWLLKMAARKMYDDWNDGRSS